MLEGRKNAISIQDEDIVQNYHDLKLQVDNYKQQMREKIVQPEYCLPFLQPGRLVKISFPDPKSKENKLFEFGWGVVVNFQKRLPRSKGKEPVNTAEGPTYIVDVLLRCAAGVQEYSKLPKPCVGDEQPQMLIIPCALPTIEAFSSARIQLPSDVKHGGSRNQVLKTIQEVERKFKTDSVPLLDPVKDMGIKDEDFARTFKVLSSI